MMHDKLCAISVNGNETLCSCDLIRRVRSDERQELLTWASKLLIRNNVWWMRATKRREIYWNEGVNFTLNLIKSKVIAP